MNKAEILFSESTQILHTHIPWRVIPPEAVLCLKGASDRVCVCLCVSVSVREYVCVCVCVCPCLCVCDSCFLPVFCCVCQACCDLRK